MLLVPLDYTGCAEEVVAVASRLGKALSTDLALLYVVTAPPNSPVLVQAALDQDARENLDALAARLRAEGISTHIHVAHGEPSAVIVSTAETEKAEMIVMGTHGRTGLKRLWAGSVAEQVLRQSPCPVTVVRTADTGVHPGLTAAQQSAEDESQG